MTAYVLIQGGNGDGSLAGRVRTIPGVLAALDLSGAFDAIALARAESPDRSFDEIVTDIRHLPGVAHALPAPVADHSVIEAVDPSIHDAA